jgi:hypothetical protein
MTKMTTSGRRLKILAGCLAALFAIMCAVVWWGYAHLTDLVQQQLRGVAGQDLTIGKVTARWNRVELEQVLVPRHGAGPFQRRLAIDRLVLRPRLSSLLSGRLDLGDITIAGPYLLLEITPDGSLIKPLPSTPAAPREKGRPSLPVTINAIHITAGSVDILDRHVARQGGVGLSNPREQYHLLHFTDIGLDLGSIAIPLDERPASLKLALKNRGGGSLSLSGSLSPKTLDGKLRLKVDDLAITGYRPYYLKKGGLDVASGLLSIRSDFSIEKRRLNAPGEVVLKGLAFDRSGSGGFWMGIPARALVSIMKNDKDELKMKFAVSGNLDNPRFAIRQTFIEQLAEGLSSKIGVAGIGSIGKGIMDAGGKGVRGLMGIFGK